MRILFLNRSYYPDVEATGQLLGELCTDLAERADVTVIAGQPNFVGTAAGPWPVRREWHGSVEVLRVRNPRFSKARLLGRALGLAGYTVLAFLVGLFVRRPDVIVIETDPPFLGPLGTLLRWWHRCRLVYYLQDLYPEVGLQMGRLRPGLGTAFLRWATQVGLRRADRVVVLGEDMRRRVLARGIDPAKVDLVPNWADTRALRPVAGRGLRDQWDVNGRLAVMYAGNVGLSQNLGQVLEAAHELRDEPVVFLLVGEGAARPGLMARAAAMGLANVRFLPYQPRELLNAALGTADVHLIPLQRGLGGCLVPSKVYSILAAGVPYVAAVDADSEVARITRTGRAGLLIEPDSAGQLVAALRWCLGHRNELREMGRRGRVLAEKVFDRRVAVTRFRGVLDRAVGGRVVAGVCRPCATAAAA